MSAEVKAKPDRTKYYQSRYNQFREQGLCVRCGKEPNVPGVIHCLTCGRNALEHSRKIQGYKGTGPRAGRTVYR